MYSLGGDLVVICFLFSTFDVLETILSGDIVGGASCDLLSF